MPSQNQILKHLFRQVDANGKIIAPPENMQYLLLLFYTPSEGPEDKTFEIIEGLADVVEFLTDEFNRESGIDVKKSFVLSEIDVLENFTPLYKFIKNCIDNKQCTDEQKAIFESELANVDEDDDI